MDKKILITTLGLMALVGVALAGAGAVRANNMNSNSPMVQKLVERFGLNEDEVVGVFEEERGERRQRMQQMGEERLDQAVEDGVLTKEQKQALIDKWAEKQAERQTHQEEMQAWFEEQGIDHQALWQYGGFGPKGHGCSR